MCDYFLKKIKEELEKVGSYALCLVKCYILSQCMNFIVGIIIIFGNAFIIEYIVYVNDMYIVCSKLHRKCKTGWH